MKNEIILGVTTLVILLAVTMPAMGEVFYLTNTNKFPAGEFNVSVTLDGTEKNISVELLEYPANITPLGFEKFTYNLSTKVAEVSEGNLSWDKNVGNPNADGFGNFLSNKVKVNCGGICHARNDISYGYGITDPLVFTLKEQFNPANIEPNSDQGSSLAVHLIYRLDKGNCTFCTWISDGVTRCHHTLGHVVNAGPDQMVDEGDILTIGLTFKDGFTKGHGGHTGGCSGEEGGGCGGGSDGSHGGSDGGSDGGSTEPCPDGTHTDDSCGGDHSTGSEAMSDGSDGSHDVSDGGSDGSSTEPCPDGTHTDDSCGGDHSTGSGGMGGGSQGVKHGQCEPHYHDVTIEWGDGTENTLIEPAVSPLDITHTYDGIGIYTVNVTVVDEFGRAGTDSMQVVVVSLDTPIDPVGINSVVTVTATIPDGMISGGCSHDTSTDDSCPTGEHPGPISELDWGDGSTDSTYISGNSVQFSHAYSSADIYTTTLRIIYNKGMEEVNLTARSADYIVVYDPDGGFVTGGGWIDSPSGAYKADSNLVGRANFGFVSKYQKGATTPTGTTEFQFKIANMNFHSDDYQWLVISGPNAKYKGTGYINGIGNYGFMLTATDSNINGGGSSDAFRIKIWDINELIVYDNEPLSNDNANPVTSISGGSIQIKTNGN